MRKSLKTSHRKQASPFKLYARPSHIPDNYLECAVSIWSDEEYLAHLRALAKMLRRDSRMDLVHADFLVFAHMVAAIAERHSCLSSVAVDLSPEVGASAIAVSWIRMPTSKKEQRIVAGVAGGVALDETFSERLPIPYLQCFALWRSFAHHRAFPYQAIDGRLVVFVPHPLRQQELPPQPKLN